EIELGILFIQSSTSSLSNSNFFDTHKHTDSSGLTDKSINISHITRHKVNRNLEVSIITLTANLRRRLLSINRDVGNISCITYSREFPYRRHTNRINSTGTKQRCKVSCNRVIR